MTLQETHIHIRCPIDELINRLTNNSVERIAAGSDGDVVYAIAAPDCQPCFGLISDLNAPMGHQWTQLLHAAPDDAEAVADALRTLKVNADMLESATDWENTPLIALGPIIGILRKSRDGAPPRSYGPLAR